MLHSFNMNKRDTFNTIFCRLCGRMMRQISTGHCYRHHITVAEYKTKFPNAPLVSESWRVQKIQASTNWANNNKELLRKHSIESWSKPENRKRYLDAFKLRPPQTEEVKEQISKTMKKVYAQTNFKLKELNATQSEAYQNGTRVNTLYHGSTKITPAEQIAKDILSQYGFEHNIQFYTNRAKNHGHFFILDFIHEQLKIAVEISCENMHGKPHRKDCDERKALALQDYNWKLYTISYNSSRRSSLKNTITKKVEELLKDLKLKD